MNYVHAERQKVQKQRKKQDKITTTQSGIYDGIGMGLMLISARKR